MSKCTFSCTVDAYPVENLDYTYPVLNTEFKIDTSDGIRK